MNTTAHPITLRRLYRTRELWRSLRQDVPNANRLSLSFRYDPSWEPSDYKPIQASLWLRLSMIEDRSRIAQGIRDTEPYIEDYPVVYVPPTDFEEAFRKHVPLRLRQAGLERLRHAWERVLVLRGHVTGLRQFYDRIQPVEGVDPDFWGYGEWENPAIIANVPGHATLHIASPGWEDVAQTIPPFDPAWIDKEPK
jgi:hypothetical protein